MSLINQALASLFNGVSQQPSQLRLPSQGDLSENYYPTIAVGLAKRPCTRHLAKLSSSTNFNAYTTAINRDTSERYVLMIRNGAIEVFDAFTGAARYVSCPSGTAYLDSSDALKDFSTVTVADYTFVVNRSKTVGVGTAATSANANVAYVAFSYNGAGVQRTMSVSVNTAQANYVGAATDIGVPIGTIVSGLSGALGAGWSVTQVFGNVIRIECTSSADPNWTVVASDTYGNSTMKVIKGAVQVFSDLPAQLDDGYVCYITSRPGDQGKGYYVKYSAATHTYIECPKPGLLTHLNAATMPHKLVRNGDGTFTFAPLDWSPRKVGDDASNPWPTFVGRKISDVFFYRNRLGFLSDENICLSTAGDYFNFGCKTVTAVLDTDPIDDAVANTKVSILRFAVPFNKVLLLFSDQTQFQVSANDVLSPKTIKCDPVTEFTSSSTCRPVGAGQSLFFATNKPTSTGIREYYVEQDTMANDAADITAHVPSYVPPGVFKMAISTAEDTLLALSTSDRNVLYAYKFYWGPQEKVQSAWMRFILPTGDILLGADFVGPVAYLVIGRSDGIYLEEMNLSPGDTDAGLPFSVLLDRKVALTGTYDAGTNRTSWTLPWAPVGVVEGVLGSTFGTRAGSSMELAQGAGNTVSVAGDYSAGPTLIGLRYTARYRFSEQHLKDANGTTIADAVVKMRRMSVGFSNSGYFRVEVTPPGRDTSKYAFTGKYLGVAGVKLGAPSLSSGVFKFPVMSGTRGVRIELVNDSPFPCAFQNAEWVGEAVMQAKR